MCLQESDIPGGRFETVKLCKEGIQWYMFVSSDSLVHYLYVHEAVFSLSLSLTHTLSISISLSFFLSFSLSLSLSLSLSPSPSMTPWVQKHMYEHVYMYVFMERNVHVQKM